MLRLVSVLALLAAPTLAAAQQAETGQPPQRIRNVTITGEQRCPPSTGDEIVVCSRISPEEQFRIPKELRNTAEPAAQNQSWVNRAATADRVSRVAGGLPDTCSPIGTGGQSGCALAINRAYAAEKRAAEKNDSMVPGGVQP